MPVQVVQNNLGQVSLGTMSGYLTTDRDTRLSVIDAAGVPLHLEPGVVYGAVLPACWLLHAGPTAKQGILTLPARSPAAIGRSASGLRLPDRPGNYRAGADLAWQPLLETLLRLWRHGEFEKGPLWFVWALLIFAVGAGLWNGLSGLRRPHNVACRFPTNAALLVATIGTGVVAFALRLQWPVGTEVWGLQLGYFSSYVVLFITGCLASAPRWVEGLPDEQVRTWRRAAWIALPVLPLVVLLGGSLLGIEGRPEGGWSIPALAYALWEPFVAWGVILVLLQRCQKRFEDVGPLGRRLARRVFAIYVIHPPVVVALALAWRDVGAPALMKFTVTGAVACVVCYLLAGLLLTVPGARRVL